MSASPDHARLDDRGNGYAFAKHLHQKRISLAVLPLVGGLVFLNASPGRALTTVCSPDWQTGTGSTRSGVLTGAQPPCPASAVTATVTVGTGANAGQVNTGNVITGSATNNYTLTDVKSVDIGIQATSTENLALTFSQAVANPYLFFTYFDNNTSFTFGNPFTVVQSNNATVSGSTISGTSGSSNSANDGFVVQMTGTYTTINFSYNNTFAGVNSVAFTAGAIETPAPTSTPTPGPLPVLGAGFAFGFSRKLRQRIRC